VTALGLWLLAPIAAAGPVADGAAAFDEGRLDEAIAAWEAPADQGWALSGVAHYDIGIAWYRKGDMPRAVARFRGAARLRPRDPYVHHNLALARAGLVSAPEPVGGDAWRRVVTPGELGLLGILLAGLGSLGMVLRRTRAASAAVWATGIGVGGIAVAGAWEAALHPVAVVVDAEAVLRDAASVEGGERFRLPPGAEVRVERSLDEFLLVEDARERRGWVARNAVELAWGGLIGR
jgi:hypothetical protein